MAEYLVNPRRAPRAPARCRTATVSAAGAFDSVTEDIGSRGCQVVAPKAIRKGEPVELEITNGKVIETLRVGGRIAWVSTQAPWRLGVAFDEADLAESARWMEMLFEAYPGMSGLRRIPDRIPLQAMVYLGAPPRFLVDFTPDEVRLLRAIASGARVDELVARLRDGWPMIQRALFSLLAHQHLTLSRGASVHPEGWKRIIDDAEGALALESLSEPAPAPRDAARPSAAPAPTPLPRATPVPSPTREPRAWARSPDGAGTWGAARASQPDFAGAGVGGRAPAGPRPAEAQGCYDRALAELDAGHASGALALLRRALALAPGDREIATAIATAMFRGRPPGGD